MIAKSNFRKGGANLRVCCADQQVVAIFAEITFGYHYSFKPGDNGNEILKY